MDLKPEERLELEEELVEKLGREGFCSVACRIIHEFRPDTSPWVITDPETKTANAHFFLFDGKYAIDMWGLYETKTLVEIIDKLREGLVAISVDWARVWDHEKRFWHVR